jgi:hypothetical protein
MADVLIAIGILVLLGVGVAVAVRVRKSGTEVKDERDPEQPRNVDRGHARSEAEAARDEPLSQAEEEEAAELVAYFEEIGTGEQLMVMAFDIDPLAAPIPDDRPVAEPDLWNDVTAGWLSRFTWTHPTEPAVPLTSVPLSEPEPFEPEGFTTGWTKAEMAAILARGKAGVSR